MRISNPYAGTWVLRYHGRNLLSFSFEARGNRLRGTWTRPRLFNYDQDGDFTRITSEHTTAALTGIVRDATGLRFSAASGKDADSFIMRVLDADHAEVRYEGDVLYDRVMATEGRLQRWGLQANCIGGKAVLAPVEDPDHLEERRRALFFPPVAVYLRELSAGCPSAR